jgi:biopolymer transport protein ExbD
MGGAAPVEAKGGKRSMDANINLVPYIDLLMTLLTFLVMTAVWTQLAVLEVQNSSGGPQDEQDKPDEEPPPNIFVILTETDIKVQEEGQEMKPFNKMADGYDWDGINGELKNLKDARPERVQVTVKPEDSVPFDAIAKVIDLATGVELTGITMQAASE